MNKLSEGLWAIFVGLPLMSMLAVYAMISHWAVPEKARRRWRPWFAWRPVRVNGRLRWLRKVERLGAIEHELISTCYWRYRELHSKREW